MEREAQRHPRPRRNIVGCAKLRHNPSDVSSLTDSPDEYFMRLALREADRALAHDDVPVGAVVVLDGEVIGVGHNERELREDPTSHAETLAIREAARALGSWRLLGTTLYVTLEPCAMCAGAMVQARVTRLVFGTLDPKAGAVGSLYNLVEEPRHNHRLQVTSGILADDCRLLLKTFFGALRQKKRDI
jgi:tRNA(adenine34) deaminase